MPSDPFFRWSKLMVAVLGAALLSLGFSTCGHYHPYSSVSTSTHMYNQGPPPWAPAHGYRYKHSHGVDLIYDKYLGVYTVVGHPHHYFQNGRYYRFKEGHWEVGPHIHGPWGVSKVSNLPPGLRKHNTQKHRGHGHGPFGKHL